LEHLTNERAADQLCHVHRYNRHVFLAPPWPEIYEQDEERRHSFAEAEAEYEQLRALYPWLNYETYILPKTSVEARADFVLATLSALTHS
jgi:predicted ATPase